MWRSITRLILTGGILTMVALSGSPARSGRADAAGSPLAAAIEGPLPPHAPAPAQPASASSAGHIDYSAFVRAPVGPLQQPHRRR